MNSSHSSSSLFSFVVAAAAALTRLCLCLCLDFDARWLHATHGFTRFHWAVAAGESDVLAGLLREDDSPPPCHFGSDKEHKHIVKPGDSGNVFTLSAGGVSALDLARMPPESRPTCFSHQRRCRSDGGSGSVAAANQQPSDGARRKHGAFAEKGDGVHQMMAFATGPWSPRAHKYFPASFRHVVFVLLCVAQRRYSQLLPTCDAARGRNERQSERRSCRICLPLPPDAWFNIFSFFGRYDWQKVPATCKCEACRKHLVPQQNV